MLTASMNYLVVGLYPGLSYSSFMWCVNWCRCDTITSLLLKKAFACYIVLLSYIKFVLKVLHNFDIIVLCFTRREIIIQLRNTSVNNFDIVCVTADVLTQV